MKFNNTFRENLYTLENKKNLNFILFGVLSILIAIPIFNHLGTLTIRNWDESRNIVNAYEMYKNGNWIVPNYHGNPDMWNTKPPLLFWLQVISMKVFGVNEFAFRLPSALAAVATLTMLGYFIINYLNNKKIAVFCILMLITSTGYMRIHVARSGDFDTILILFTSFTALSFFLSLHCRKTKYIYLFYIGLTLAILAKGVAGLLFLPAFLIYAILSQNLKFIFTNKHFYIGVLIVLIFGVGYYPLRELYNPGYLEAVYNNELGGRFNEGIEGNGERPFTYYLNNIIVQDFKFYIYLFIIGLVTFIASKNIKVKRLMKFSLILSVTFLLIISSSQTKLSWYDSPIYPFISIIAAFGLYALIKICETILNQSNFVNSEEFNHQKLRKSVIVCILIFSFLPAYYTILIKTNLSQEPDWNRHLYKMTYFLRDVLNGKHDINDIDQTFISLSEDQGIKQPLEFYQLRLKEKGTNIEIKDLDKLEQGDVVFAYQDNAKKEIEEKYNTQLIKEYKDNPNYLFLKKYKIINKK